VSPISRVTAALLLLSAAACVVEEPAELPILGLPGVRGRATFGLPCASATVHHTGSDPTARLPSAPRLAVGARVTGGSVASARVPAEPLRDGGVRFLEPGRFTLLALTEEGSLLDLLVVQAEPAASLKAVQLVKLFGGHPYDDETIGTVVEALELRYVRAEPTTVSLAVAAVAADGVPLCGGFPVEATLEPPLFPIERPEGPEGAVRLVADSPGSATLRLVGGGGELLLPIEVR